VTKSGHLKLYSAHDKMKNILLFITISMCSGCLNLNHGFTGASPNMAYSKEKGVFEGAYSLVNNPTVVDTLISCNFKEIWVEKRWRYGKWRGQVDPFVDPERGSYQLIIETDEQCLRNFRTKWYSMWTWKYNLRTANKKSFIMEIREVSDTILLPIYLGNGDFPKNYKGEHKKIGEFVLVKKKE
jgi:hypothetical protein